MEIDYSPSPPPPPPPPPQPLLLEPLPLAVQPDHLPSSSSLSFSPSLHIIAAILACVFVACASIHLLLRLLSSSRSSSSSVAATSLLVRSRSTSASVTSTAAAGTDKVKTALIDSLPIFNLSSSLAALPKSSPDCAVCLRPFRPDEELRLLPACCHAFHSGCVEPWIRNSPSCPLCRAPVTLPLPPLPSPRPPCPGADPSRSGSFSVEIGSASLRRTPAEDEPRTNQSLPATLALPPRNRTSSIGLSLDYLTAAEEELDAVVDRIRRRPDAVSAASGTEPPGEEIAGAAAAGGGGSRGWLRDYMDRLASSASSSFRFSGRWSQRYDEGGGGVGRYSMDLEGNVRREEEEDDTGLSGLYRWIIGV